MAKPGIMLYFDVLEPIRALPDREKGRLLTAMLEYGQTGKAPQFTGRLALAWGFVKPRIDRDEAEYHRAVLKRQFGTVCRERKRKGEPEVTFDEWVRTNGDQWYPTTEATAETATAANTKTETDTSASTAAAATTCAAAAAESAVKAVGGTLGKNVVFLSDAQMEDLLERMDLQSFDYYVDKLSEFILRNDARVKNHYETILRWYEQDGLVRGGR